MTRNLVLGVFLLLLITVLNPSTAQSALIYEFDQANYTIAPGGTVNVDVFLTQTAATTLLADEGLRFAGVRVFFDTAPLPMDRAEVVAATDITPNPAFNDTDPFFTGQEVVAGQSAGFLDGVALGTAPVTATGNRILLGTFTFTGGTIGGEVTNLRATDFSGFAETISGVNGTTLDGTIGDGFATITVNSTASATVPEPSGLLFGLFAVTGLVVRRRRPRARA